MTSLAIADVPWISKRIKACCRRAKLFSTHEILLSQPQQLQQTLRISSQDADLLYLQVATACAPPPISVLAALTGELPSAHLDEALFDATECNDADSADLSDSSDGHDDPRIDLGIPSSSIVPPTQGYDGNFPGAERFVYDSDSDSDSGASAAASDHMMHDDVELPSTFRRPEPQQLDADEADPDDHLDSDQNNGYSSIARDVLSLGRQRHLLSSGSQQLDDLLGGGFRSAALTEIVGESASGKTQTAIQACTFATLGFQPLPPKEDQNASSSTDVVSDGLESANLHDILHGCGVATSSGSHSAVGACFITSAGERAAHSIVNRALELADFAVCERFDRVHPAQHTESSQSSLDRHILLARALELGREQVLRNLHVACVADVEALEHALKYSLPGLMSRLSSSSRGQAAAKSPAREIGIIVVDNLPSLFQEDPVASDIDSLVQRSKMLVEVTDALKRLAAAPPSRPRSTFSSVGRAVLVINHVSDAFGVDKEIAKRFVFDSADRIRIQRSNGRQGGQDAAGPAMPGELALPDSPFAMDYASQSAFFSGLLASVPPTLAEAIGARALEEARGSNDGPLYVLNPRTAQLGHTWSNLVNVRLFLSKTRGRVSMPDESAAASAAASGEDAATKKTTMTTVRKAAVALNPFGPTMLDPTIDSSDCVAGVRGKKAVRQLRFVITPGRAVHALNAYAASSANPAVVPTMSQMPAPHATSSQAAHGGEAEDEEDLSARRSRIITGWLWINSSRRWWTAWVPPNSII
ncbi:DNA recombination and repair protein Rad51, C-terminal [Kalmanozyma brasiliensis GHG001]|uniref:DNA recombination and repair protein Rad51, C-terminal n=1 Tax=Kalmanozyma brasiliensis (strain GHG001) TaxID=1365824 RepID=UPI002867EDE2|nr:DNA recombination and repair protein Rad51, C-terminal [Kalmanozyma brasiliensis GHG001]KAF6767543.1 DNA recombination and repair protein Rad51, C-terminal [Kalmanozyma brasiliensis GHG001]